MKNMHHSGSRRTGYRFKSQTGFTLVEVLVVIAMVAIF
ncbi:MAG: type II secretion system protein, partial [Deltaproteobacteria bacterium]|nr:type II secretion system protein [Deltaproteobacteria bacterium]